VRNCKVCDAAISAQNVTGYCRTCYCRSREKPRLLCEICGVELSWKSKTPRCGGHRGNIYLVPMDKWGDYDALRARGIRSADIVAHINAGKPVVYAKHKKPVLNNATIELAKDVADKLGLPVEGILSGSRLHRDTAARAVMVQVMLSKGLSLGAIGRRLGRHHSSIMNLRDQTPKYIKRNPMVGELIKHHAGG